MRKKMWKKFLPITMAVVIFATSLPVDTLASTVSQNTVTQPEQVQVEEPIAAAVVEANTATSGELLDGTTVALNDVTLKATYKEEGNTTTTVVDLVDDGTFELPYNADINMRLNFTLGDGNAIEGGKTYTYTLPSSIRVDVEAEHELEDGTGKSIGKVHISKDGTLSFQFYEDVLANNKNVDFYVQFEGGLSEDLQEAGKEADITFPTASGDFNIKINTTDSTENTEDPEPKDISIQKSGSQVMEDGDGRKMIEWTVELGPEGRDTLDGTIVDVLPAGLTYVPGSAVLVDAYEGSITESHNGQRVEITLNDVKAYWHAKVKFRTYYDEEGYGYTIDNSTSDDVTNEAIFNPSDGTNGVTDAGTVWLVPDVVSKSGSAIDANGDITWTVILNREQLDIQGTTYTDTFGTGMELNGDISISPAGATVNTTETGFTVEFPTGTAAEDTYTVTYKTKVTDWTVQSYENKGVLTGGVDPHSFNYSEKAVVPGMNLLDKSSTSFNTVTNTLTWTIVVNEECRDLTNVVVTDTFDPKIMEFISASEALGTASNTDAGRLVFNYDTLSEQKTITIVTRVVNPEEYDPDTWNQFINYAELDSTEINVPISDSAERWTQVKEPELMSKSGQIKDGVIEWTVTINEPQLTVEGIDFSDVLPEKTEYIEGTFRIQNMYYDANPLYRDPMITTTGGQQEISYTLDATDEAEKAFYEKGFWIVYQTKVTDIDTAAVENSYTNGAKVSVEYEGDVIVDDDVESTVTGIVGGVIDKTYTYKTGDQTVEWDIAINQGRSDMSDIQNPKITDQLADYFDYVDGTLYLVDTKGNETEVAAGDYIVSVVNNKLIVQLPKDDEGYYIDDNCYIFRFTTRFNVLAAELEGKQITNTADFQGSGHMYVSESNSVNNVSFSSSSAGAVVKREIRVKKVDADTKAALPGAKFELYLGTECIGEATSGSDGFAVFEDLNSITGYTVTLKEVQAPDGYKAETTETEIEFTEENLKTENGIDYYEIEIENTTKASTETGNINIEKVNADGELLPGAVFGLYSDAACTTLVDSRTATDGTVSFSNLEQATYYVKEISSPAGYKVSNEIITVVIGNDGTNVTVTYESSINGTLTGATKASVVNEKAMASLKLIKQDSADATTLLSGATFSIYKDALCTDRVDTLTTNANGEVTFTGLELGKTYYYRETAAPSGYILDTTIYEVTIGDGTEVTDQTKEIVVKNTEALGNILIHKVDNSATPVPLEGVEFGLYESDGVTPVKNDAGSPYVVTTDESGVAAFNNIPFGDYIVKEINAPDGYAITVTDTAVTIKTLGDTEVTIINEKIVVDIQIIKEGTDGTDTILLPGAEFGLYTDKGVQVAKGTTGDDGKLVFRDIPYGNYYIEELKAPEGYNITTARKDITAADLEAAYPSGILGVSISNTKQNGKIEITKVDAETPANPLGGAEFTLYDENMIQVSLDGVTNPATSVDGTGVATFTGLPYGTYYVQETKAPDGYVRDTGVYKVIVSSDDTVKTYTKDDGTAADLQIVNIQSDAPYISFKVMKTDSETGLPLANATFELYKNGQPCDPAITAVTGTDGIAYFRKVQVKDDAANTIYSVHEVAAPTGYKITEGAITLGNRNSVNVYGDPVKEGDPNLTDEQILWAGGTNILTPTGEVENDPLKGTLKVTKTALTSSTLLSGAEFTLYDENRVAVNITGVTNPAVTGANGVVTFTNLPVGIYYLKETKAPKGYTLNTTETRIVVTDETVQEVTYRDTPINVSISKKAVGGESELIGAVFKIYKQNDADKKAVDSWTTTENIHRVLVGALEIGETYVLTEMVAPAGYGHMEDQVFTVNEDGSITVVSSGLEKTGQTLVVRDKAIKVAISKQDAANNTALPGAILGIYDENGVEIDRFTSNTTSYDVPIGKLTAPAPLADGNMEAYKVYTIKEISAPDGYQLAEDIKFAVKADGTLHSVSELNGVTTYAALGDNPTIVMKDELKPSNTIYIRKLNDKTGLDISGATLTILNTSGVAVATIETNGKPCAVLCGNGGMLEFDTEYILRETNVPAGYLVANDIHFSVSTSGEITIIGANNNNLNGDKDTIMMRDQELVLNIRKQDSFGQVLNGAVLTVSEYDRATGTIGTEIAEFTSGGGAAQSIPSKDLEVGKCYVLHEVSAPDGYKKTADIIFEIKEDGSLVRDDGVPVYNNTIVMEDDEAGLSIGKISLNTNQGLAGSTLELTTVDDPYFTTETWVSDGTNRTWDLTDFTPGCTYVLTELKAPLGYALTDPIVFTIDADDHQVYINGEKADNRTVHIADGKLELAVDKLDFYSKENVKGAKLGIYDDNGNLITSWTSGAGKVWVDTSKMVVQADGYQEYILREIEAPAGYKKADDIRFAFDRDGKVYLVSEDPILGKQYDEVDDKVLIMYDTPYIRVEKVDSDGNPVIGAKLEITATNDASFTPITWTTDGKPYWFEDGTFKEGVTYVLKELQAPAGYTLAEDIEFTVDADGNLYVKGQKVLNKRIVMLDYRVNSGGAGYSQIVGGVNTTLPKTGDGTPLGTLMLFATFALFGACMTFGGYIIRRRREQR